MALFSVLGMALCYASVPSAAVLVRAELYLEFNRDFEDYETILNKNLHHLAQILCQYEN